MNILIVKLTALGDITHTLPALTTLRRALPNARITWLVEDSAQDLVRGHPALDRVLVWNRSRWKTLLRSGRLFALASSAWAFRREIRDTHYDLVIDFQGLLKSAVWVALSRAESKAGYGPGQRHDEHAWLALNKRVAVSAPDAHAVERNLRLLEGLGFPRLPLAYDFPIPEPRRQEADHVLSQAGLPPGTRFVAVHSMTRWPTKNWTPQHFAAVADAVQTAGIPVALTGGPADRPSIDAIVSAMKTPARRLDGQTSLPALAAVFQRASVVLSTDTGPMHLAVAVGTPVVALFGPTSPEYTGPYGTRNVVLRAGLRCSPCFRRDCRTTEYEPHACMLRLDPAQVAATVLKQLDATVPAAHGG